MKTLDKIFAEGKNACNTFLPDEMVYIEEKVDGANFRVWRDETDELRFGSRTVEFLPESDPNCGYGAFTGAVEFIKSLDTSKLVKGYIYFFEAMHKHTINYNWETTPRAILFDLYNIEDDIYEHRVNFDAYVPKEIIIPCIYEGRYEDFNGEVPMSKYYNGLAEGYVIKPSNSLITTRDVHGNIHRAKVVRKEFKEENKATFGSTDNKEAKFVNQFVNDARIEKHLHKIADTIGPFELKYIGALVHNIIEDIVTEEFKKVLKMQIVNFMTITSETMIRVKRHLSEKGVL